MNRNMRYRPNPGAGSFGTYRNLEHNSELMQQRGGGRGGRGGHPKMAPNKPFNRKRQYGNEHSSQNFVTYETNQGGIQNFAYLYDDGPGPSYDHGHMPNKKRQKINVWDIDVFGAHQVYGNQRANYAIRQNSPPRPLMSLPGPQPKIRRIPNPTPKAHKNIPPSKAKPTKPTPVGKPTKISAPSADKEQYILRADKVPCQQMVGRLELALGSILKEMKTTLCTNTDTFALFTSKVIQRSIKQTIRERIKSVMLNKHVGKYVEIIEAYRKRFPQNSDKDVLDMAVMKTGAAEQHVKLSFDKLLVKKVNNTFKKLLVLVEEKETEVAKLIETRQLFKDDKKSEDDIKHAVRIESDFYTSVVDSLLAARLPKILPNYASCIVKMLKREGLLNQTNGDDANNDDGPIEFPDSETDEDALEVYPDEDMEENSDPVAKDEMNESAQDEEMKEANDADVKKEDSDKQGDDTKEVTDKVTVKDETEANAKTIGNDEVNDSKLDDTAELDKSCNDNAPLFLAKVLCQPELPSKAEAYKFLKKFNMANIKKHKTIQNLLVVGFKNEKDYNDLLAASGTVIENSKLIIKGNKQQGTAVAAPVETEIKDSKDNQLLSPELENQITDLLTSISEQKDPNSSTEGETEIKKEDAKGDANAYSPSTPYNEEAELDTIKEGDESQDDGQDTAETAGTAQDDGKTAGDDKTPEDATSVDNENSAAEGIDKNSAEGNDETKESLDKAQKINKDVKNTPVRSSSRLASTPINVKTRRASRLAQNN